MGFDGKQCIHPDQLSTANLLFSPENDEVARAERVIQAYEHALDEKRGAASLDGRMIDMASLRLARVVREKHRLIVERTA